MKLFEARNLGKNFPNGKTRKWVFRHVDFALPEKGLISIEGKSGSGKSTLLNLLALLEKPDEGSVLFAGKRLSSLSEKEKLSFRQKGIGMVFQHYNLIEGATALENVSLASSFQGKEKKKEALSLLEKCGLKDKKSQNVNTLSGGEKQRVAICRALINHPLALLCDEPTGALDEKNSLLIMDLLKEISKTKLVVLVSHNHELVERYSDEILSLKEGKLDCPVKAEGSFLRLKKEPSLKTKKWGRFFLKRALHQDKAKNIVCFFAGVVGWSGLLLASGYFAGSKEALSEQGKESLEYGLVRLQEKSKVKVANSPLSLVQNTRPSLEECEDLVSELDVTLKDDFSFFLPEGNEPTMEEKRVGTCYFEPVYSFSTIERTDLLIKGEIPIQESLGECLINDALSSKLGEDCLGKTLAFPVEAEVDGNGEQSKFEHLFSMKISGVVREFPFLEMPKVYFSYLAEEEYFSSVDLGEGEERKSIADWVKEASGDSPLSSYCRLAFCHEEEEVTTLWERAKQVGEQGGNLVGTSSLQSAEESFLALSSAFASALSLFVGISLISLVLMLGMSSYSSYVARRKETAVLLSLGADPRGVRKVFYQEAILVCCASSLCSFLLSPLVSLGANFLFLQKFGLKNLIRIPYLNLWHVPFLLPFLFLFGAAFVGFLSSYLPLAKSEKIHLAEELRDE